MKEFGADQIEVYMKEFSTLEVSFVHRTTKKKYKWADELRERGYSGPEIAEVGRNARGRSRTAFRGVLRCVAPNGCSPVRPAGCGLLFSFRSLGAHPGRPKQRGRSTSFRPTRSASSSA